MCRKSNGLNKQKPLKTGKQVGGKLGPVKRMIGSSWGVGPRPEPPPTQGDRRSWPFSVISGACGGHRPARVQGCSAYLVHLWYELPLASHAESQQIVELLRVAETLHELHPGGCQTRGSPVCISVSHRCLDTRNPPGRGGGASAGGPAHLPPSSTGPAARAASLGRAQWTDGR